MTQQRRPHGRLRPLTDEDRPLTDEDRGRKAAAFEHPHDGAPMRSYINPYAVRKVVSAQPDPLIVDRPVLTLHDLDRMVAARLAEHDRTAERRQQEACAQAWEEGHSRGHIDGYAAGTADVHDLVRRVINGRLIHIARRLLERPSADREPRNTIAKERERMRSEGVKLQQAIRELEHPGG